MALHEWRELIGCVLGVTAIIVVFWGGLIMMNAQHTRSGVVASECRELLSRGTTVWRQVVDVDGIGKRMSQRCCGEIGDTVTYGWYGAMWSTEPRSGYRWCHIPPDEGGEDEH